MQVREFFGRIAARLERGWPPASLRSYLFAVILLAILPLAGFMTWQVLAEVRENQDHVEDNLSRAAAAFGTSVERELASSFDALAVLSHSELFQQERIRALGRLLQGRPRRDWDSVFLLDRDGTVLLDTAPVHASPAELARLKELHQRVMARGEPAVAGLGSDSGPGMAAIALPILQNGSRRFVLGARIVEGMWQRIAAGASKPEGARALLIDERQRLIGHSGVAVPAGTRLPEDVMAPMMEQATGVHRSVGIDGAPVYAAWYAMPGTGWIARVAIPAEPVDASYRKQVATALSSSGISLLIGLLLAAMVARRIGWPLRQLATQGPQGLPGRIPVHEVALLRDALQRAQEQDAAATRQLRDSQRMMDVVQEAGHVGFLHYQFAPDRLVWSPGHCKLFGLDAPPGEALKNWFDLLHPADRDRIEREFWTACALRRETQTLEYCVTWPDGESRWLSSRVILHYDAAGRALQMTGVTVDMTDQKESELQRAHLTERALQARREAEEASRAKDEFLTMLSHELRNPLGAISAAVDVLDSSPDSGHAAEAREIIGRQTRNLAHMMNDLLDVGRVIAGKILLARQPVNLRSIVERVEETIAITGEAKAHQLQLKLQDAWVDGDSVRIEQIVTNLVTNAIKYTPAGRTIRVGVREEKGNAILQVRDAGMGIPPSLLPHVFDLFVQGQRTLDRRAGGLGIGLTLVRRLAEMHGGSVGVESSDEGSVFTVRLPAVAAPQRTDGESLPPSRRRNVLVVEDNDDVLSALRAKLELDGHSVSTAVDGIEGLTRLLMLRPEVSIVDIGLPGLTGYELARHARAAGYAGRMIALSGYGAERDAQEALIAGFDAYLVKPVDRKQLRASLSAD